MKLTLAATWHPRGEMQRFQRLHPRLAQVYANIVITLPPDTQPPVVDALQALPGLRAVVTPEWSWGRYLALQAALETPCDHVQYADLDRLLRWVETLPQEWQHTVAMIAQVDCLVVGRTPAAYATHPQALVKTEEISNRVVSHLLGQPLDASAGSKGFSRRAAEFIIANSAPSQPYGVDAEWLVLLHRAGFGIKSVSVDGLDWESADRFKDEAAGPQSQRQEADAWDEDPAHWAYRVQVALEIVQAGLDAAQRELKREPNGYGR